MPDATPPITPSNPDDKTMALLACLLGIITGFLGPLVIFIAKREKSRFVGFHALQMVFWHLLYLVVTMPIFGVAFFVMFGSVMRLANAPRPPDRPPVELLVGFAVVWLTLMTFGLTSLIVQVVMAVKASGGQAPRLPIIGKWAARHASP